MLVVAAPAFVVAAVVIVHLVLSEGGCGVGGSGDDCCCLRLYRCCSAFLSCHVRRNAQTKPSHHRLCFVVVAVSLVLCQFFLLGL